MSQENVSAPVVTDLWHVLRPFTVGSPRGEVGLGERTPAPRDVHGYAVAASGPATRHRVG